MRREVLSGILNGIAGFNIARRIRRLEKRVASLEQDKRGT